MEIVESWTVKTNTYVNDGTNIVATPPVNSTKVRKYSPRGLVMGSWFGHERLGPICPIQIKHNRDRQQKSSIIDLSNMQILRELANERSSKS